MLRFFIRLFCAEEFDYLLAGVACVVFCWPMFAMDNLSNPVFIVSYYFLSWGGFIVLQFISSVIRNRGQEKACDPESSI